MRIVILIVLVIFGLAAVACTSEAPSPADNQTASQPTPDIPATVEASILGTREAEAAIDATVEAKVAAALTASAPTPAPLPIATPRPTNTPYPTTTPRPTPTVVIVDDQGGSVASDRAALAALYNATEGGSWNTRTNWLSGRPLDEWHGVTTDSCGRVTALNLVSNRLVGALPAALGDLTNLRTLILLGQRRVDGADPGLAGRPHQAAKADPHLGATG